MHVSRVVFVLCKPIGHEPNLNEENEEEDDCDVRGGGKTGTESFYWIVSAKC